MPYAMGEYYERVSDYDLEYQGQSQLDLPFWRELVERYKPQHILELACGSGRISLELLKLSGNFALEGLDIEPDMLKAYRRRLANLDASQQERVTIHEADMTDFNLAHKGQFDLIILPFNSIAHLYELEQQFGTFRCVYEHLAPGGHFVVDTFLPDIDYLSNALNRPSTVYLEDEIEGPEQEFTMLMYTTRKYEQIEQVQHITWTHEKFFKNGDNERYLTRLDMHVFFPRELQILFLASNLVIDAIYGSYDWKPLGRGTRQIVIGRKPIV